MEGLNPLDMLVLWGLWITLHSAAGTEIYLNPRDITTVRHAETMSEGMVVKGVHCIITTSDGKFLNVTETCERVLALIAAEKEEEP